MAANENIRMAVLFELRKKLSFEMADMVRNPAKYNNADVQDYIRDFCKKHNLQFMVKTQKGDPNILHLFVRDPILEPVNFVAGPTNPTHLGWVEKNTKPT